MNHYTVIGVYEDPSDTFAEHVVAGTPEEAIIIAAGNMHLEPGADQLLIIGAVPGHVYLMPASRNGRAAYALDLAAAEATA